MTETKIVNICCPGCVEIGQFTQYKKIDINKNSEMREKIFSRDIFKFKCPDCGEEILVSYNTIYFDEENNYIICLLPEEATDEDFKKYSLEGYNLRIVRTINNFIEKIAMLEDGIDDRVIELYKLLFEEQFEEQYPKSHLLDVFYAGRNTIDDKLHFFFISDNNDNCETTLGLDTYRNLYEHFISTKFAEDNFAEIDSDWALDAISGGVLDIN